MLPAQISLSQALREPYPQRDDAPGESPLDEAGNALSGAIARGFRARSGAMRRMVAMVAAAGGRYDALDRPALLGASRDLRERLRRVGLREDLVAESFALVRAAASSVLGMRHFDSQVMGGWVLMNGMVAEMDTGEGKTLVASLPACTAAMAGIPVHVITVNDYLVARDFALLAPLYEVLGISAGAVVGGLAHAARQSAYRCEVTYCSNKEIVFDYLRDRIELAGRTGSLQLQVEKLYGQGARVRKLLLRGLAYAIVDEADSVLVDEARTPLIISAHRQAGDEQRVADEALRLAGELTEPDEFRLLIDSRSVRLTDRGRERLAELAGTLGGIWNGTIRREELVTQALAALHLFRRDEHYLVRDGKVQVIDEYTGRVLADRSWGRGIHQLIEAREGCEVTGRREPLASISYQRFFRRYLRLAGMTGTAREVAGELGSVYDLAVVRVPTHRPARRRHFPDRVFATEAEKWRAIVARIGEHSRSGRPVLVGTRSVAASEHLSGLLQDAGLQHRVLNAKQDKEEAEIVAAAGSAGRITIATNMAGRGTDIKLAPGIDELGGLHVILTERHEAGRIDRQLAGRGARQGDRGSVEAMVSLEDPLLERYGRILIGLVAGCGLTAPPGRWFALALFRMAQKRAERLHAGARKDLLRMDQQLGNVLSYTGRPE
jgi:preprotein translocase subunit SecA